MARILVLAVLIVLGTVSISGEQEQEQQSGEQLNSTDEIVTENPECTGDSLVSCYNDLPASSDPKYCSKMFKIHDCLKNKAETCLADDDKDKEEILQSLREGKEVLLSNCDEDEDDQNLFCLSDNEAFKHEIFTCTILTALNLAHTKPNLSEVDAKCLIALHVTDCISSYILKMCGEETAAEIRKEIQNELSRELSLHESALCSPPVESSENDKSQKELEDQQEPEFDEIMQQLSENQEDNQQQQEQEEPQTFEMDNAILRKRRFLF